MMRQIMLLACALILPVAAAAQDRMQAVVLQLRPQASQPVALRAGDIAAVAGGIDPETGMHFLNISLHDAAAARVAQMSRDAVGQQFDMVFCDRVVLSPVLRAEIPGSQLRLSGIETSREVDEFMGVLHGIFPCPKA